MIRYPPTFRPRGSRHLADRAGNRSGFALVIALSLMAFILLLVLSLTTLVRVESRSSSIATDRLSARQNALLGLMVAVGDLQKHTGPDTRTTAAAGRLDTDPESPETDGIAQPRWTGVWRLPEDPTSPDNVDPQATPERLGWLVSRDPDNPPDPSTAPANPVRLASAVDDPDGAPLFESGPVEVPKRTIGDDRSAFAYWIDDEGAKAKLNAVAPNHDPDAPPELPLGNGAPVFDQLPEGLGEPGDWLPGFPGGVTTELLIAREQDSDDSSDAKDAAAQLGLHTTLFGHRVRSDTLRGGLQLDLSAIMGMPRGDFASLVSDWFPGKRMYEPYIDSLPNAPAEAYKGPVWDLIRQYGELGDLAAAGDGSYPIVRTQASPGLRAQTPAVTQPGIFPVIEKFQMYVVGRISGDLTPGEAKATYRPRLYFLPAIVLWNPYNKPLEAPNGLRFNWNIQDIEEIYSFNYAAGEYVGGAWRAFDIASGGDTGEFPEIQAGRRSDFSGEAKGFFQFRLRNEDGDNSIRFPPGESRVFTMTRNDENNNNVAQLNAGFRNHGFYIDAEHTFSVERPIAADRQFYLDIRTREAVGPGLVPPFHLMLKDSNNDNLQQVVNLRWRSETDRESAADTVSELSSHTFGNDPNASAPFPVDRGDLRGPNQPAKDDGTNDVAVGYEAGLRNPLPQLAQNSLYEQQGERLLASLNLRGRFNDDPFAPNQSNNRDYDHTILFQNTSKGYFGNQNYTIQTWNGDATATYLGFSDTPNGNERFELFHLPARGERIRTVGELRHLDIVGNNFSLRRTSGVGWRQFDAGPAFVVGEARADPIIPLDSFTSQTFRSQNQGKDFHHVDHQWLANRQIWDRFFVSTVSDSGPLEFPLPNGRMVPVDRANDGEPADPAPYRDARTAAANLWTDGAFNVNSTSVPAWKALLAHYLGRSVPLKDGGDARDEDASPFIDLPKPLSGPYIGGTTSTPELYTGFRRLDRGEIDALAREIVRLVKERGPFASMAGFVNRSIREAGDLPPGTETHEDNGSDLDSYPTLPDLAADPRIFGLLQAAIETVGLNEDLRDGDIGGGGFFVTQNVAPWRDTNSGIRTIPAGLGAFMEGAPGYLTQGKILRRLGPVLSARSDTFRIRAYGETTGPVDGSDPLTAYCEAIVQRRPEYVDANADAPETRPQDLSSTANRNFGRQYRVIAFRWLGEEEL